MYLLSTLDPNVYPRGAGLGSEVLTSLLNKRSRFSCKSWAHKSMCWVLGSCWSWLCSSWLFATFRGTCVVYLGTTQNVILLSHNWKATFYRIISWNWWENLELDLLVLFPRLGCDPWEWLCRCCVFGVFFCQGPLVIPFLSNDIKFLSLIDWGSVWTWVMLNQWLGGSLG